ncbi:MAG: HD domain-containing protein [Candidatus Woesearchaeota archaeon]
MILPTEQQCLDWFEQFKVPKNILEHCLKVREVANFLAQELKKSGINLDLELVNRSALLHDLFKVVSFKELVPNKYHSYIFSAEETVMWKFLREKFPNMHEGEASYTFFKEEYPELALCLKIICGTAERERTWEEMIVYYADLRVFRNEIVSVAERTAYLQEIYPHGSEWWDNELVLIHEYEQKIIKTIGTDAESLSTEIKSLT